MKIRFSSLSRDFEEKKARKIFVLGGIRTRDLALHIFRWRATLQSCVVPAFSAPWCSCCMVGPDGAVAFFYGQGSNPARHRVNPSIQRPSHCLDYSSSLASPAGSFLIVNVSVVRDSNSNSNSCLRFVDIS